MAFREERGNEHGAGVAGERHVVVVQHVSRHAVDQRRVLGRELAPGGNLRRRVLAARGGDHARHDANGFLVGAGDHHADAIGDADARGFGRAVGKIGNPDGRGEFAGLPGEFEHCSDL